MEENKSKKAVPEENEDREKVNSQAPEEKSEKQEEYAFLQETIKDEEGGLISKKKKILETIGYGVLFALVVSIIVAFLVPRLENLLGPEKKKVDFSEESSSIGNESESTELSADSSLESSEESTSNGQADGDNEEEKTSAEEEAKQTAAQTLNSLTTTAMTNKKSMASLYSMKKDKKSVFGAGVVIADNGKQFLILSDLYDGKDKLVCTLADGKDYELSLVQQNEILDLAVYGLDKAAVENPDAVKAIVMGSYVEMENDDPVIVLGSTQNGDAIITYGTVSADEDTLSLVDGEYRLLCTNIQQSSITSGVMLDENGRMVGLIKSSIQGKDSNSRVGGYDVTDIEDAVELLSNGKKGAYVGVYGMDVSKKLAKKGMPVGVYVKEVAEDSPAMSAGIQSGDVITEIDGKEILTFAEYKKEITGKNTGDKIKILLNRQDRNGEYREMRFTLTVGEK